ncbi:MAG: plasmid mobilization relaxosome protein MobC [Bifidobacterium longum]
MARKRRCRQNGPREKAVLIRVDDDEKRMIQDAARRRGQTVSLTVIEAVKLLEGSLYVEEEEHDSPTVQALRDIEYQLRRIGRNVNQIAHNANREMNATIEDEASASYAVRQCRELIDHLDAVIGQSGECPMTRTGQRRVRLCGRSACSPWISSMNRENVMVSPWIRSS